VKKLFIFFTVLYFLHRSNFVHYFFSLCFSVKKAFQKQKIYLKETSSVAVAISQRKRKEGFICAVRATLYQERESVLIIKAAEVLRLPLEVAARFRLSGPSQTSYSRPQRTK
jgi:hypothetical protein